MQVVNEERAKLSNGGRGGMRGGPGGMFRGGMGRGGPPGAFRGRGGGGRGGGSGWPSGAGGGYETQELFPVPSNKVSVHVLTPTHCTFSCEDCKTKKDAGGWVVFGQMKVFTTNVSNIHIHHTVWRSNTSCCQGGAGYGQGGRDHQVHLRSERSSLPGKYRLYATCVSIRFFEFVVKDVDYDLECKAWILCGSLKCFVFFTQIRSMLYRILYHLHVESEKICFISYNIYEMLIRGHLLIFCRRLLISLVFISMLRMGSPQK
jgi:hypothetical protein